MAKGIPFRDKSGKFMKGRIPINKIILPRGELRRLYWNVGSKVLARHFKVSKQTILRNLREFNIPIRSSGVPKKLPEYWKKTMRKSKSIPSWNKGLTKESDKRVLAISKSLKGEQNPRWRPEIRAGEMVECKCGCGELINKYDKKGRKRKFIFGHCNSGHFKQKHIPWNLGKKWDRKVIMKMLIRRIPNNEEKVLINLFKDFNLPYKYVGNGAVIIEGKNPDFINYNGQKKIIEFFGEHWHPPEDEIVKRKIYEKYGYDMLAIWGKELKNQDKLLFNIRQFNKR